MPSQTKAHRPQPSAAPRALPTDDTVGATATNTPDGWHKNTGRRPVCGADYVDLKLADGTIITTFNLDHYRSWTISGDTQDIAFWRIAPPPINIWSGKVATLPLSDIDALLAPIGLGISFVRVSNDEAEIRMLKIS